MRLPIRLFAALLILVLAIVPIVSWSSGSTFAHAAGAVQRGPVTVNAERAQDNDDDKYDNDDGDNDDGDDDNDNEDNDDDDDDPPPPPAPAPPPPPPLDLAARCLQTGDELVVEGPNGALIVRSYQSTLNVELARLDHGSLPRPGAGEVLFAVRMAASPCGGQPYTELPSEVNIGMTYNDQAVSGRDESKFALMFYDGQNWAMAPKHFVDHENNHVSSSSTRPGVYALVQQ